MSCARSINVFPCCFRHWRREECLQRRTVLLLPLAAHGSAPHRCAFPSQGAADANTIGQTYKKATHKGWFFSVDNPVYFDTRNDCTRYSSANAVWIRKMQPSVYLNGEYLDDKRKHNQFVIMSIPLWSVAASIAPTACAITCPSALMKKEVGSE